MLSRITVAVAALATLAGFMTSTAGRCAVADDPSHTGERRPGVHSTDSPCSFEITFTGTGTIALTTYYHQSGAPLRQGAHGALTHTIFSAWHTLTSNGPAPVHIDLANGQMVDTGKAFAFHVPGDRVIFGQSGRLTLAADGSQLSFVGHSITDTAALCAALAP